MKRQVLIGLLLILIMQISGCGKTGLQEPVSTIDGIGQSESENLLSIGEVNLEGTVAITVRINPEAILYLDVNQVVVYAEMVNQDAKNAYEQIEFKGMVFTDALETMVDTCVEKKYLTADNSDIEIVPHDESENDILLANQMIAVAAEQINGYINENQLEVKVITENSIGENTLNEAIPTSEQVADTQENNAEGNAQSASQTTDEQAAGTQENDVEGNAQSASQTADEQTADEQAADTQERETNCEKCSGTGICHSCNGTGYLDGATSVCKACGGDGYMTCTFCQNGFTSCNRCGGSGIDNSATCSLCGGSGRKTCQYCGGKGEYLCMHCPGDGVNRYYCTECSDGTAVGDGKCSECHGTGVK